LRLQKWQSENINENTSADFLDRSPLSNDAEIAPTIGNYFSPRAAVPSLLPHRLIANDCKGQQAIAQRPGARALVVSKQIPAYSIRGNAKEKAVNNPNKDGFLDVESQRRMDKTTPRIKY
jgi:hypothetical protein